MRIDRNLIAPRNGSPRARDRTGKDVMGTADHVEGQRDASVKLGDELCVMNKWKWPCGCWEYIRVSTTRVVGGEMEFDSVRRTQA